MLELSVKHVYLTHLRERIPKTGPRYLHDIKVGEKIPILDPMFSYGLDSHDPTYKFPNIRALSKAVEKGDIVMILGGGRGVTAVVASQLTGSEDSVVVYEPMEERASITRRTLEMNGIREKVELREVAVGSIPTEFGFESAPDKIHPSELEECDVIEIDVEGAETEILSSLEIRPREIIVETHGFRGAPSKETKQVLEEMGYDIISNNPVDRGPEYADENDAYVLRAVYERRG